MSTSNAIAARAVDSSGTGEDMASRQKTVEQRHSPAVTHIAKLLSIADTKEERKARYLVL